jgi:hypothetical protein
VSDSLPAKRLIPSESFFLENNNFDIFIDTTNINSDYTNELVIEYSYDDTTFYLETEVQINPILPAGEVVLTYVPNSIILESSKEKS